MGLRGRFTRILRSPRTVLGSLAALDLARLFDLFASIPEWLVPTISIGVGLLTPNFIAETLTWAIIIGALYVFVPHIFPTETGLPRKAPGFRVLVTLGAFGVFLFFSLGDVIGFSDIELWQQVITLISVVGLTGAALTMYLVGRHGWRLVDPHGYPTQLANHFFPSTDGSETAAEDFPREGWQDRLSGVLWVIGFAILVAFPAAIAGIFTYIIYTVDPLPDLLVLGWVTAGTLGAVVPDVCQPTSLDIEARLYQAVSNATRSFKGMVVMAYAVLGLSSVALVVVFAAVGSVPLFAGVIFSILETIGDAPVYGAVAISWTTGFWLSMFAAGLYGIWFWLRVFRRLPAFLAYWEGEYDVGDVPTRPPGLLLPPAIVMVVLFRYGSVMMETLSAEATRGQTLFVLLPLAVGWPLLMGILVVPAWLTRRLVAQGIAYEDHIITASFALEVLTGWLIFATDSGSIFLHGLEIAIFIVMIFAVSLLPNIVRFSETSRSAPSRYLLPVFVAMVAVLSAVLLHMQSPSSSAYNILLIVVVVTGLGTLGITVTIYYGL